MWMELAKEIVHWRAFMNTVMDFWVSQKQEFLDELDNYQLLKEDPISWSKVT
jgi:hypothetical protein